MRIMGVDYGDARIGIALSDPLGLTAQGYDVLDARRTKDVPARIAEMVRDLGVARIVVGYPLNMNGTAGARALQTAEFAETLRAAAGVPVDLMDERLSTVSAERMLIAGDVSRRRRRLVVDKVAAALILQTYLDGGRRG